MHRYLALVSSIALMYSMARAAELMTARLYELVTETSMPHLEENLRYTTIREQRCLDQTQLATAFPVLNHVSLKGCSLSDETREQDTIYYELVCAGGNTTKGSAVWQIGEHQISGVLNVKLGGKNLTFYQRVTGKPLGPCATP